MQTASKPSSLRCRSSAGSSCANVKPQGGRIRRIVVSTKAASSSKITPTPGLDRRSLLLSLPASVFLFTQASSLVTPLPSTAAAVAAAVDWAKLRADILAAMTDPETGGVSDKGPTLVRLAWHSSGTYDKMTRTGGSGQGTIRFQEELAHGANAGLNQAVAWLEPVHAKHPNVSYADLYTLSGAVAVEAMGGPAIKWRAGRVDAIDPSAVTPDGRLPEADSGSPPKTAAQLRTVFGRMGFGDREIVALSGAHALGRCHLENSGYVGPWTPTPTSFNNLYFTLLLKANWTPDERVKQFQYKDASGTLMMLPSDLVLIQDENFRPFVEEYAKGKKGKAKFFEDFSTAFTKLEELGTTNLYEV